MAGKMNRPTGPEKPDEPDDKRKLELEGWSQLDRAIAETEAAAMLSRQRSHPLAAELDDLPELDYTKPGLPVKRELELAAHGEPGHVCDGDRYPNAGNPEYKGPHVTDIILACGSPSGEFRATCACGYLSRLLPSQQSARVAGWVHRRRANKAPRVE